MKNLPADKRSEVEEGCAVGFEAFVFVCYSLTYYEASFIARSLPMTATGSVSPVTFCIAGSCVAVSEIYLRSGGVGRTYIHSHENIVFLRPLSASHHSAS